MYMCKSVCYKLCCYSVIYNLYCIENDFVTYALTFSAMTGDKTPIVFDLC